MAHARVWVAPLLVGLTAACSAGSGSSSAGNGAESGSSSGSAHGASSSSGSGSGAGSSSGSHGSSGSSSGSSSSGSGGGSSSGSGSGSSSGGSSGSSSGSSGGPYTCNAGLPSAVADLQAFVDTGSDTTSTITPMGVHFEGAAKITLTSADKTFLSDPTQQPSAQQPGGAAIFGSAEYAKLPVTLYPASDGLPEPADINQHDIGNCDGCSALASLAYENPQFIQSLITDNKDGTYGVHMFDPMGKPMTVGVDSQFLVESGGTNLGQVSGKNNTACWSTVLEKAYFKYNQVYGIVSDVNGIGSEHTTPMFTGVGGSFAFNAGSLAPADIPRAMTALLAAGKLITGGFSQDGVTLPAGGTPVGAQSVTAHGFAELVPPTGFMAASRNPWGIDQGASGYISGTDGVMDIPSDASWAAMMDFRVIEPGAACGPGQTTPYVPKQDFLPGHIPNIHERHALTVSGHRAAQPLEGVHVHRVLRGAVEAGR